MVEEVVLDNPVAVGVSEALPVATLHIDLVTAVVLARQPLGGKEDIVILLFRAKRTRCRIIVPFLDKQDAGLGAGVGLEGILMKADDCKDAAALGDELPDALVARVIESSLWEDNSHTSAGPEEVEIPLDEEEVAANGVLKLPQVPVVGQRVGQIIGTEHVGLLDVSGEGRICHEDIEAEVSVVAGLRAKFSELFPTLVVGVEPLFLLGGFLPALEVEGVEVEDVGLAVAGDEIETTGDADGLLVEVDGEDFILHVLGAAGGLLLHGEEVGGLLARVDEDLTPDMEDAVHGEASTAASGVDEGLALLRVEHLHAHVDDPAWREVLPFLSLARFVHEILEGIIDDIEVGVEKFPLLKRANADL